MTPLPNLLKRIDKKLDDFPAQQVAQQCGWSQRTALKIEPAHWIQAFCYVATCSRAPLRTCAWALSLVTQTVLSKQAVHKRLRSHGPEFLKQALTFMVAQTARTKTDSAGNGTNLRCFTIFLGIHAGYVVPAFPQSGSVSEAGLISARSCNVFRLKPVQRTVDHMAFGKAFLHANTLKLVPFDSAGMFAPFARVLVQDSTILSLPDHLAPHFPGGKIKQ